MSKEHTPTPWKVTNFGYVICDKQGREICSCFGSDKLPHEVQKTNAALIVRAVNSHEAMKEALDAVINKGVALHNSAIRGKDDVLDRAVAFSKALDQARAALALATKGSNE